MKITGGIINLETNEISNLKEKVVNLEYFINRDTEFAKLTEEEKQSKVEFLKLYKKLLCAITSNDKIFEVNTSEITKIHPLEPYATNHYRYRFGKHVVPTGELFGKDLVIESIDISVDGDVYTVPINFVIPENGRINFDRRIAVIPGLEMYPDTDGFARPIIYFTGKYSKGNSDNNGGLIIHAKAVYHGFFSVLSYTVKAKE